jgi:hypothetical protein
MTRPRISDASLSDGRYGAQLGVDLIGLADEAMYRSKRRGGGSCTFHGGQPAEDGSNKARG